MNVIITGASGFIGNYLREALQAANHRAIGYDRKTGADLNNQQVVEHVIKMAKDADVIVHLAGECSTQKSLRDPGSNFINNTMTGYNIAEVARVTGKPIIYTSTCKVEPGEDGARTPYGLTKYITEEILDEYAHCYGLRHVINRPGTIYGPGQEGSSESGWISWFIKASQEGEPIIVNGDGSQKRDLLFVGDYVNLLLDQIFNFDKYAGGVFPVGGGPQNEVSIMQILEHLKYTNYAFGKPRKGDLARFVSENELVSKVNNWSPKVGWQEGIELTVKAYQEVKAAAEKEKTK